MKILMSLTLIVILAGCVTPQKTAYKTLEVVGLSVDKAMQSIADAKMAGKVSNSDWEKVRALKREFNVSYNTACDLAGYDYSKFAPEQLLVIQARLFELIETLLAKGKQ